MAEKPKSAALLLKSLNGSVPVSILIFACCGAKHGLRGSATLVRQKCVRFRFFARHDLTQIKTASHEWATKPYNRTRIPCLASGCLSPFPSAFSVVKKPSVDFTHETLRSRLLALRVLRGACDERGPLRAATPLLRNLPSERFAFFGAFLATRLTPLGTKPPLPAPHTLFLHSFAFPSSGVVGSRVLA